MPTPLMQIQCTDEYGANRLTMLGDSLARDLSDDIEWEAVGYEQWLASGLIGLLGVLSLGGQFIYITNSTITGVAWLLPMIPILLSLLIVSIALTLPRSWYGRFSIIIAAWALGGAIFFLAVGQLLLLFLAFAGADIAATIPTLSYMQTIGTASGVVIGIYDSRSKRTREQVQFQAQQLSVLNRLLRHDLRTGVQVIQGSASVLPDPDAVEPMVPLERIERRAEQMAETADTVTQLQRMTESGNHSTTEVDLSQALHRAADALSDEYLTATVTVDTPDKQITVQASPILELGLRELIENGLEHNDKSEPRVYIECTNGSTEATIEIVDNGPGISDSNIEPLDKGRETALIHAKGIGLWLANWTVRVA